MTIFLFLTFPSTKTTNAIIGLLNDPVYARMPGSNLRQKVEASYSANVLTKHWEAVFDEVIEEKRQCEEGPFT